MRIKGKIMPIGDQSQQDFAVIQAGVLIIQLIIGHDQFPYFLDSFFL